MARGGKRKGTPGTSYAQRSDLNAPKVDFEGPYGSDKPNSAFDKTRRGVNIQQVQATAQNAQATRAQAPVMPRQVTPLDAPDDRPSEPVTAGLNIGPGPGAPMNGDPARLAKYLPVLEVAASQPGSSRQLRQFVRILRGSIV